MPKLPSMQFYPGDWRKDPGVQALDYETRGIWFEIILLMFESSERGKLLLNGLPMPEEALSKFLGLDKQKTTKALTKLSTYGVISKDESGVFYSRRMIRDEEIRAVRAESGKLGGNPLLKQTSKQNPTPSIEDEVEDEKEEGTNLKEEFLKAVKAYPSGKKRGGEVEWADFLKKHRKQAKEIVPLLLAAVQGYNTQIRVMKTEPQFIKHFQGWITEQRWTVDYGSTTTGDNRPRHKSAAEIVAERGF